MKAKTMRHTIIGLLMATGIFHLAVALLGAEARLSAVLAIFGLIYIALSFFARRDTNDGSKSHSRNAIIATVIACVIELGLVGFHYVQHGEPMALPLMLFVNVVIIGFGAMWFKHRKKKK